MGFRVDVAFCHGVGVQYSNELRFLGHRIFGTNGHPGGNTDLYFGQYTLGSDATSNKMNVLVHVCGGGFKVHYFNGLPLSLERDIYLKEVSASRPAPRKKISTMITDLFREKLDKSHPPTKCGMLQVRAKNIIL